MNKKLLLIRGHRLNKWEMQNYEPLQKYYDIKAVASYDHRYPLEEIKLPIIKLHSLREIFGRVPKVRGLFNIVFKNWFLKDYLLGLDPLFAWADIVHSLETQAHYIFSYQTALSKPKYGYRLVITHWENIPFAYEDITMANRHIKPRVQKETDHFLAITEMAKAALLLEGVPEERISVVNYGVDLQRFCPKPKNKERMDQLGLSPEDVVLLFIGRFVWEKGVFEILFAMKTLLDQMQTIDRNRIKCLLIGSGEEKNRIREVIARLNLNHTVKILPDFPYHDIPEIHNVADIFLLPSAPTKHLREQYGMVLVEAMAMGKPVISTTSGSIPEVVGVGGLLIPPADHVSLFHAMKTLIESADLRMEIGKRARLRAEQKFDATQAAQKIRQIYQKVLLDHQRNRL